MKSPDAAIDPELFAKIHFEGTLIPHMAGKYAARMIVKGMATLYHGPVIAPDQPGSGNNSGLFQGRPGV